MRAAAFRAYLTPLAIALAGAMIGAALYFSRDGGGADISITASDTSASGSGGQPFSEIPAGGRSLADLLAAYAVDAGLNEGAFAACLASGESVSDIEAGLAAGAALGVNGTPTFFINGIRVRGALTVDVFTAIIDVELGERSELPAAVEVLTRGDSPPIELERVTVVTEGGISDGAEGAPVTVVEFADFQCPFCARWAKETRPALRERYGDDVRIVFMHYPLRQIHANAPSAAVAAWCAGAQGDFWAFHDLLFERQREWSLASR